MIIALEGPESPDVPLILDSPHSGSDYPADFDPVPPMRQVRQAEDLCVDRLFGVAPELGVPLFKALFPRIYVDVNRARDDIDPATVAGALPFVPAPSAKARLGKGVIWMDAPPPPALAPLYGSPLAAEIVTARLENYWAPYRTRLADLIAAIRQRHGRAYYIDCHSMQSVSTAMHEEGPGVRRADIVLGDRRGASCSPEFTATAAQLLDAEGFAVAINEPYQGADLVRAHGAPAEGVHALQIEVRRDLYMDEDALTLTESLGATQERLGRVVAALRERIGEGAL